MPVTDATPMILRPRPDVSGRVERVLERHARVEAILALKLKRRRHIGASAGRRLGQAAPEIHRFPTALEGGQLGIAPASELKRIPGGIGSKSRTSETHQV